MTRQSGRQSGSESSNLSKNFSFVLSTAMANEKDFFPLLAGPEGLSFLFMKTLSSPSILMGGRLLCISTLTNLVNVSPYLPP